MQGTQHEDGERLPWKLWSFHWIHIPGQDEQSFY